MATIKKAQTGGSLGSIWTGPMNENPGVVKAKADKVKANTNVDEYKKKSDAQKAKAIEKAKLNKAKDGKWIQKAVNPAHKGFCTPQTKKTCTPRRKALAQTLRKIAKKK